jgi:hypothetical protein
MKPQMSEFYTPKVKVFDPVKLVTELPDSIPSDAIILFNGIDLSQWKNSKKCSFKCRCQKDYREWCSCS